MDWISVIIKLKIPTIVIIGIFLWSGNDLLKSSSDLLTPTGVAGAILIGVGVILGIIAFIDYRYKEQTDGAIDHLTKAMGALSKVVKSSASTNSTINKAHRETVKGEQEVIGAARMKYSFPGGDGTATTGSSDE